MNFRRKAAFEGLENSPDFISVSLADKKSLAVELYGPKNTPYEGGRFTLTMSVEKFPFDKPKISLNEQIYHPFSKKEAG